jgi:hypothetical protein
MELPVKEEDLLKVVFGDSDSEDESNGANFSLAEVGYSIPVLCTCFFRHYNILVFNFAFTCRA